MDLVSAFLQFALLGAQWVLWLLVLLSVISIGVMVDRAFWFRRKDTDTDHFVAGLQQAFANNDLESFVDKHQNAESVPIAVAVRGLRVRQKGASAVTEAMQAEKARWRKAGERNLMILGTLGNNVPFIGLFGTVLGIIKAFDDLKAKTTDSESLVMAGIAEALVATAIGLLVAIPAVIAFNYFQRRLKVVLTGADECAHAVLSEIHATAHASTRGTHGE